MKAPMNRHFFKSEWQCWFSIYGWILAVIFSSCSKQSVVVTPTESAYLSITHAAPKVPTLQIFMDDKPLPLTDSLRFGTTTVYTSLTNPYLPVKKGNRKVEIGFSPEEAPAISFNEYFEAGKAYSLFVLDTLKYARLKYVLLKDDFKKSMPSGQSGLRFLNLSPNAPPLDLYIVQWRTRDTIKIAGFRRYPAYDFNTIYSDQQFAYFPPGDYWMEARESGSGSVILKGGLTIEEKKLVTIYTKGWYGAIGAYRLNVGIIEYLQE
ncbi:MAG TPA: DUF4397 domain-containing protein [Flavitalea sp.]|nr:DUF4397 domain-containing protein [Flavitalea sp.]